MGSNFEYLKKSYPDIYKELSEGESFFYKEDIFLLKIRKAMELIFIRIAEERGELEFIKQELQNDSLLYMCMKACLESYERDEYHTLRKRCNDNIHGENLKGDTQKKRDVQSIIKLTKKLKDISKTPSKLETKYLALSQPVITKEIVVTEEKIVTKEVIKEVPKEIVKEVFIEVIRDREKDYKESIEDIFKMYRDREMPEDIEKNFYILEKNGVSKLEIEMFLKKMKVKYNVKFFSDTSYLKIKDIKSSLSKDDYLNELLKKAESRNAYDYHKLANHYIKIKNEEKAIHYFKLAANDDFVQSQLKLGEIYENRDKSEAIKWYKEALEMGSKLAKERLESLQGLKKIEQKSQDGFLDKIRRKIWL
ncbi:hypothetical protein [Cetobacterium sp.]|uniref:tetratricopeptide repeat protein n=1 Tax=Cetobacterium sp. TaxID=2071632 RepID=UPI003F37A115